MEQLKQGLLETSYARVRDLLRQDILAGVFEPGFRLRILDLSRRYGVSSMPIREALQQLQGEGLVTMLPQKGASVRSIDEKFLGNMYDIRMAVETMLIRTGLDHMTDRDLGKIEMLGLDYEACVQRGDMESALQVNEAFHNNINSLAENPEALDIMKRHWGLIDTLRKRVGFSSNRVDEIVKEHREIVEAMKKRDRDTAARVTYEHASKAKADLLSRFRNNDYRDLGGET